MLVFDYKATIDGKDFTGGEGKNTQIILGKIYLLKVLINNLVGVAKKMMKSLVDSNTS